MTEESIFDDPFFIATVNAQTRAMNKFDAEYVHLERETTKRLYEETTGRFANGMKMKDALDLVLHLNEPFTNDAERGGYKIAIGMTIAEVRRMKKLQQEELDRTRPFTPR